MKNDRDSPTNFIATVAGELGADAVGLWQLQNAARYYGLEDKARDEFIRACLSRLFDAGARPLRGSGSGPEARFVLDDRYSDDVGVMADKIVERLRHLGNSAEMGDIWFGIPPAR